MSANIDRKIYALKKEIERGAIRLPEDVRKRILEIKNQVTINSNDTVIKSDIVLSK